MSENQNQGKIYLTPEMLLEIILKLSKGRLIGTLDAHEKKNVLFLPKGKDKQK